MMFVVAVRMGRGVRRVAIRRMERAAAAGLLLALCTVPGCADGSGPDKRPWSVRVEA